MWTIHHQKIYPNCSYNSLQQPPSTVKLFCTWCCSFANRGGIFQRRIDRACTLVSASGSVQSTLMHQSSYWLSCCANLGQGQSNSSQMCCEAAHPQGRCASSACGSTSTSWACGMGRRGWWARAGARIPLGGCAAWTQHCPRGTSPERWSHAAVTPACSQGNLENTTKSAWDRAGAKHKRINCSGIQRLPRVSGNKET